MTEQQITVRPGTVGTATVRGVQGVRVMRARSTQVSAWFAVDAGGGLPGTVDEWQVTDFVADGGQVRCVHGATAEELCNRLPSDAELAEMRDAQSTVTRLRERLGRLTPEAVVSIVKSLDRAELPDVLDERSVRVRPGSVARQILALIAEAAPVPDSARAAELIRFHLQRPDISASDRAELAAFADSLDAKPDDGQE